MKVTTSKSKNSESFYIAKSFINSKGISTSINIRKLGTLAELLIEHGPTREDVMTWAREEAKAETKKYKEEKKIERFKSLFMQIVRSPMISRYFIVEDTFFSNPCIIG